MKIFSAAVTALIFSGASATIVHNDEIQYHTQEPIGPAMWLFSATGLRIQSVDGERMIKQHVKTDICPPGYAPNPWTGEISGSFDCSYFDVQTDGHQYVWGANHQTPHRIDIFDINTGDYAGFTPTCSTPLDLNYHPVRREMWTRCASADEDSDGEIDVFSTNSLSSDHVMVKLGNSTRPYGRMVTHSSLGNIGYATQYDANVLTKFDLSSKEVRETFQLMDGAEAAYDFEYSPVSKHLYIQSRVCCAAGCGRSCEGSEADTLGVMEFDTFSGQFIGSHNSLKGNGVSPLTSPDGKYIVLLPYDGGETVRLLMAGTNGQESELLGDAMVGLTSSDPAYDNSNVITDVAFIQDENRNFLVVAAGTTSNDVVFVDLDDPDLATFHVTLSDDSEATASTGNRNIEWARGTDYVWINGGEVKKMYVVRVGNTINSAVLVKEISGINDGKVVFVNNYVREAEMASMAALAAADNDDGADPLAAASLIISLVALLWAIFLTFSNMNQGNVPTSEYASGAKSVGSKRVA